MRAGRSRSNINFITHRLHTFDVFSDTFCALFLFRVFSEARQHHRTIQCLDTNRCPGHVLIIQQLSLNLRRDACIIDVAADCFLSARDCAPRGDRHNDTDKAGGKKCTYVHKLFFLRMCLKYILYEVLYKEKN